MPRAPPGRKARRGVFPSSGATAVSAPPGHRPPLRPALLDTLTVFSVEVFGSSMCPGAAHPNSWQYGLTYDMTTGRRYNPLALYRIGTRENGSWVKLAPAADKLVQAQLLTRAGPECRTAVIGQLPETGLPYGQIRAFLNPREAARLHWRL